MSLTGHLRRIARVGVTPHMDPSEVRCVVFVNMVAIFGATATALCLIFIGSAGPAAAGIMLGSTLALLSVLGLNRLGLTFPAQLMLCLFSLLAGFAQLINLGPGNFVEYFLLTVAMVPFFALPRQRRLLAHALGIVAAAGFLAAAVLVDYDDRGPTPFDLAAGYTWALGLTAVCISALGYYARSLAGAAESAIARERRLGDDVLDHALPRRFVASLRDGGSSPIEVYDQVSVLQADVAGFTPLAESISPEAIVELLNEITLVFDALCIEHGAEKIKTVGDAFIAAAGIPDACTDHAERLIALGTSMLTAIAELRQRRAVALDLRIGIATGPVVAGVVGKRKFSYEIWGPAAALAEQLEAHGEPGVIHIAGTTRPPLATCVLDPLDPLELPGHRPVQRFALRAS